MQSQTLSSSIPPADRVKRNPFKIDKRSIGVEERACPLKDSRSGKDAGADLGSCPDKVEKREKVEKEQEGQGLTSECVFTYIVRIMTRVDRAFHGA
jgi:hypothetical protein